MARAVRLTAVVRMTVVKWGTDVLLAVRSPCRTPFREETSPTAGQAGPAARHALQRRAARAGYQRAAIFVLPGADGCTPS
jgi:hypothetical protein